MATEKTLKTRIKIRTDTYVNWSNANPVLLKGEIAIVTLGNPEANTGVTNDQLDTILLKVGDGTTAFVSLPWVSGLAADVYTWAKAASKPIYTFSEITSKPTTLSGYGITDASINTTTNTITLGNKSLSVIPASKLEELVVVADLANYLPLTAGVNKALTGDLYLSDGKYIKFKNSDIYPFLIYQDSNKGMISGLSGVDILASSSTYQFTSSALLTNNSNDLGTSAKKWKNLYLTGTINGLIIPNASGDTIATEESIEENYLPLSAGSNKSLTDDLYFGNGHAAMSYNETDDAIEFLFF